jgi:hypothetical protein
MSTDNELPSDVLSAIHENHKIKAIKLLREHRNIGLKESKQIVDAYIKKNPHLVIKQNQQSSSWISLLFRLCIIIAVLYFIYKLLT